MSSANGSEQELRRARLGAVVAAFKADPESVYNTWFINNDERLKAFGAIRRGVEQVITDIKAGSFPTDYKGSSLEVVVSAIAEQKQVFEGAAHPFYWKPKLRIPDIYENDANKTAFGQFLESCRHAKSETHILRAIKRLDQCCIKGLGPAVANILYFLHPTSMPPFNTAIVRGFNIVFGAKMKLGSWSAYLQMREDILALNGQLSRQLSKDLGAIGGLLFDIGVGKVVVEGNEDLVLEREKRQRLLRKRHRQVENEVKEEGLHTHLQYVLLRIGRELGYDVHVATNDRLKSWAGDKFSFLSVDELPLPEVNEAERSTIRLIDVLWLERESHRPVCAYEVEKSTSIYSGILRLKDLALTLPRGEATHLYLVVPDVREKEVVAQLRRPSMQGNDGVEIAYILSSDLLEHCDAICKLGDDHRIMRKVARYCGS